MQLGTRTWTRHLPDGSMRPLCRRSSKCDQRGWAWTNHSLGAPFGQQVYDYPIATDDPIDQRIKVIGFSSGFCAGHERFFPVHVRSRGPVLVRGPVVAAAFHPRVDLVRSSVR